AGPLERRQQAAVERGGQLLHEPALVGGGEEVALRDEDAAGAELLDARPHERALAGAPRGDHDHVLAALDVGPERSELGSPIGELRSRDDIAVPEGVLVRHAWIIALGITPDAITMRSPVRPTPRAARARRRGRRRSRPARG